MKVFEKASFSPVKMTDGPEMTMGVTYQNNNRENSPHVFDIDTAEPVSVEQIIMAQQDEPNQKNCIFKLQNEEAKLERFYQIRVKSIEFL